MGLKRKAAAATAVKSGARPAKVRVAPPLLTNEDGRKQVAATDRWCVCLLALQKARKGDEKEEDEDEEADAFAAFGRSGSQAALSALKQDLDDKARNALCTSAKLACIPSGV